jgi:hypothetical protein
LTLAPSHRKKINQQAHTAALRYELEIRAHWIAEITLAFEAGASFDELQERIAKLAYACGFAQS